MSIRRRLVLIVVLSAIVLTAAVFAIAQLVSTSDSARVESAETTAGEIAEAMAATWTGRPTELGEDLAAPAVRAFLQRGAGSALTAAPRAATGLCRNGDVALQLRHGGRREGARPFALPPELLAVVAETCRGGAPLRVHVRGDTVVVAIAKAGNGWDAWASIPVRTRDRTPLGWKIALFVLASGTLVLVIVTLDAIVALRRGAGQLDDALHKLRGDLGASIDAPRAEELARIATGLQEMAKDLRATRGRELELLRSLEHEQRLAGLGRVAAGVAHEVRNPLAGMKLRLDLMARAADLPEELRTDVDACLQEVDRLDRVVRSLLGVARRDPGERKPVDLAALVDERIALASETTGVTVVRRGSASASTDPDALARVIDNLLRNAIEASPPSAEVVVELASGERTTVTVVDRGPGVPDARVSELFEPFFTTKPEGTGLGLWMSRSLVQALGGTLDYARDGDTSRFTVALT